MVALSLAGWGLLVAVASGFAALVGVAIALAGFFVNRAAIRGEKDDRRQAMSDEWSREWARQWPLLYPRLPSEIGGQRYLKIKNGGRGPALNVQGELRIRDSDGEKRWGGLSTGAIAAGDEEIVGITGPLIAPPWPRVSGELRYMDLADGTYVTHFDFQNGSDGDLEVVLHPQEHTPAAARS